MRQSARLARFYALCASTGAVNDYRDDIAFFEEVRVWMAKFDAEERKARGLPVPADVALYLRQLTAGADRGRRGHRSLRGRRDRAARPVPPRRGVHQAKCSEARHPQLAIEALRRLIEQEMRRVTRHNIVRQQSFSDRLLELMRRYTNQHLTAAEIIAELVAIAREVSADADRGQQFSPALTSDELAFYDAVAQNESAVSEMGIGILADIARDLVQVAAPRRDHGLGVPRRRAR